MTADADWSKNYPDSKWVMSVCSEGCVLEQSVFECWQENSGVPFGQSHTRSSFLFPRFHIHCTDMRVGSVSWCHHRHWDSTCSSEALTVILLIWLIRNRFLEAPFAPTRPHTRQMHEDVFMTHLLRFLYKASDLNNHDLSHKYARRKPGRSSVIVEWQINL